MHVELVQIIGLTTTLLMCGIMWPCLVFYEKKYEFSFVIWILGYCQNIAAMYGMDGNTVVSSQIQGRVVETLLNETHNVAYYIRFVVLRRKGIESNIEKHNNKPPAPVAT